MSKGLILPKRVFDERQSQKAVQALLNRTVELDIPDLVELPWQPDKWLMVVSQVTIKKVGSIEVTEQSQEDQLWTSGIGRVIAKGPAVYKGRQFAEKGLGPDDAPKVGDYVIFNAKTPLRFEYKGRKYITINDDATLGTIKNPEEALANIKFTI